MNHSETIKWRAMDKSQIIFVAMFLVATASSAPVAPGQVIDLSYKLENDTISWPGTTKFRHMLSVKVQNPTFYVEYYHFATSEHMGTHMDAPRHFNPNTNLTVDQIPLDIVMGDAVVVNMSAKAAKDPDAFLMTSDLEDWEREHGRIPDGAVFLLYTGWGRYWGDEARYFGTASKNASLFHFPGIHPNTTQWLVDNRKIKMYGVDTISTDQGESKDFETHQVLASNNIPGLENVANLDKLPAKGATVYAAPLKIARGSGAPCRVFATVKKGPPPTAGSICLKVAVNLIVAMTTISVIFI